MNSPRFISCLLPIIACVCGLSPIGVSAAMGEQPLPALIGELQHMPAGQSDESLPGRSEELFPACGSESEQKRQWLKPQWAALSSEERDLLHKQILEHWQQMTPEQREKLREAHQPRPGPTDDNHNRQQYRSQRLSPDERQEFHHWMRIRQGDPS